MLYNSNYSALLLGCLMKNPSLLFNPSYPLSKSDFSPEPLHRILFGSIVKLAESGAGEITEIEIDGFVKNYPEQYEILNDSDFMGFIVTVRELANLESYELYYNTVRKFALLRELKEKGISITEYYDEMLDETEQNAKLNKWSIQDILDDIETRNAKLRNKYDIHYVRDEMVAGEDTESLIAEFEETPAFGAFRSSPFLTQLFLGLNKGHLQMHSAPSGVGKSKMSIMDLCYLSSKYLWDDEQQDFVENINYSGPGLFIATEMNLRKEINPNFLACISGVSVNSITQGQLTSEEKERVIEAGRVLQDTQQIILTDMPDFTSASIERKIKEKVESNGIENVVFDYLQLNGPLAEEYKNKNGGVPAREDLVIRALATDLKAYAEKYNVRMITSSQLNGHEKDIDFPDESCLSSAKSIKQKLDGGVIYLPAIDRAKEMKIIEPLIHKKGFGENRTPSPNMIGYVYKSRFGLYADKKIKIVSYFDRSRLRIMDYLALDIYNKPAGIPRPILENKLDEGGF